MYESQSSQLSGGTSDSAASVPSAYCTFTRAASIHATLGFVTTAVSRAIFRALPESGISTASGNWS
jgi:hypothetical protein